jgi:hypothetical protein
MEEIRKYFELSENESTAHQNLGDKNKAKFRGVLIALSVYIRKKKKDLK